MPQFLGTDTPSAGAGVRFTPGGTVRAALGGPLVFSKTGITTGQTTTLNYGSSAGSDAAIPSGFIYAIHAISMMVPSDPNNGQKLTVKLLVDGVDVSASFGSLLVTGTAGVDSTLTGSCVPTSTPYLVDASAGIKRLQFTVINDAGATVAVTVTIFGCLYKP